MSDASAREVLTVEEAAAYLRMSVHWVYKQSAAGTLPRLKLGRVVRFRRADLDAWLQSQTSEVR